MNKGERENGSSQEVKDEIELLLDINFPVVKIPTNRTRSPQRALFPKPSLEELYACLLESLYFAILALIHHQKNLGRKKETFTISAGST